MADFITRLDRENKLINEPIVDEAVDELKRMLALLLQVKLWRDSDGNEPFPHALRADINRCVRQYRVEQIVGKTDG